MLFFSADPVYVGVGVTFSCEIYLIIYWPDRNQICMDMIFGHDEDWIRFW